MQHERGFTLIELSIVLVVIGLIVGGVLVGQDLIAAATVRAQITQLEKYNTAVHTFQTKFDALPGDMPSDVAARFLFPPRSGAKDHGDGNGLVDGQHQGAGELGLFWVDLSQANLVDGSFTTATDDVVPDMAAASVGLYMPLAKIGHGNHILAGNNDGGGWGHFFNGYFILQLTEITGGIVTGLAGTIPVIQVYNIDKKLDDGMPLLGNIIGVGNYDSTGTPVTCIDYNGHGALTAPDTEYSIAINQGAGANCAFEVGFK